MASTLTNLLVHLVFSTKDRRPLIPEEHQQELYAYIGGIIRSEQGILMAMGGMPDHIHILFKFKSSQQLSEIVRTIKASSSKWFNDKNLINTKFAWQTGYGAFSVSESQINRVIRYINTQKQHHEKKSFEDELVDILKKHNVEYDNRYLWG